MGFESASDFAFQLKNSEQWETHNRSTGKRTEEGQQGKGEEKRDTGEEESDRWET